jgi:hypothetical protein
METNLIHTSACSIKNLWQVYRIYGDRLELDSHFGKFIIPFDNIEKVVKSESDVKGLFQGGLQLKEFRPALKLDMANFTEHIVIDKNDGKVHRILFTPDNIDEFNDKLNSAIADFRKKK